MPPKKGTRKTAAKKKGAPAPAPASAPTPAPAEARKWIPSPSTGTDVPVDPTAPASWEGAEPENEDEMQDWMARERALVFRYLEYWREQTEHGPTRQRKEILENALNEVWDDSWKPLTDSVTGEIYDATERGNAEQRMAAAYQTSVGDYNAKVANKAHRAYQAAQGYWEDFLHYQNAWNRPRDKVIDPNDPRFPPIPNDRKKVDIVDKAQAVSHVVLWQRNLIRLYNRWDIGNRAGISADGIGPNQLHSMPDNFRHSEQRRASLQRLFPTGDIHLNHEAINTRRDEVDQERREKEEREASTVDERYYATTNDLPDFHETYHAATEFTRPYMGRRVHTSWESDTWAPVVANKEQVPYRKKRITVSKEVRYRTISVPRMVREKRTVFDENDERRPDHARGGWLQEWAENIVWEDVFELDDNDERIPNPDAVEIYPKPRFRPKGIVQAVHERNGTERSRRGWYELCENIMEDNEKLSLADEDDYQEDYVPLAGTTGDDGQAQNPGPDITDEDTDLFRQSYLNRLDAEGNLPGAGGSDSRPGSPKPPGDPKPPGNPKPPGKGKGKKNKGDDEGSDDDKGDDDKPDPGDAGVFKIGTGEDEGFRIFQNTYEVSKGITITQRDRMPLEDPSATKQLDDKGQTLFDVIPKNAPIPTDRKEEHKELLWKWENEAGIARLGTTDITWRPVLYLRKFRKDTGAYVSPSNLYENVKQLLATNFSKESIKTYNKKVHQYMNRNDSEARQQGPKQPPWTLDEITQMVRILNQLVVKDGLGCLSEKSEGETLRDLGQQINDWRENTMNMPRRGLDAVRTKLARSDGYRTKRDFVRDNLETESKKRPGDHFTVNDIDQGKKGVKRKAKDKDTGKGDGDEDELDEPPEKKQKK